MVILIHIGMYNVHVHCTMHNVHVFMNVCALRVTMFASAIMKALYNVEMTAKYYSILMCTNKTEWIVNSFESSLQDILIVTELNMKNSINYVNNNNNKKFIDQKEDTQYKSIFRIDYYNYCYY